MKTTKIFLLMALLGGMLLLSNCSKDEVKKTEEELYVQKLSTTWKVEKVTLDAPLLDVTSYYTNMTLTVKGDKTYTTTNGVGKIWPASGTYTLEKIANSSNYTLKRSDGVAITITQLTDTQLIYTFQYTSTGGRAESVSGKYEFTMKK